MWKFTKQPKTPGITLKNMAFSEGNHLFWMKKTQIWFHLQRDGTGNGLSNIKDTATNVSSAPKDVHLQGWSLKFKRWLGKYEEKIPDVSDPNQVVQATSNYKLKFTGLEDLFIKRVQKI